MTYRSETPTPWAVICLGDAHPQGYQCNEGKSIFLTEEFYHYQMAHPDYLWQCPLCQGNADWDDDNYKKHMEPSE